MKKNTLIHELFEIQAKCIPNNLAVVAIDGKLTYKELDEKANQLANAILNLQPNCKLIPIYSERSSNYIVAILGVLKAGFGYIPLDSKIPLERINAIINESRSVFLISDESNVSFNIDKVIDINTILGEATFSSQKPSVAIAVENVAYTIFTSGSTGVPKGVMISHQAIVNYTISICTHLDLPENAQYAHVSTLTADLGLTMLFPVFQQASVLHLLSESILLNANKFSNYIKQNKIDCLKITPSHFNALLDCEIPEDAIPRKKLIFGGEGLLGVL